MRLKGSVNPLPFLFRYKATRFTQPFDRTLDIVLCFCRHFSNIVVTKFWSKFQDLVRSFVVPPCPVCPDGGTMMTDVVFFGDNVPKDRVEAVRRSVSKASALLVVGSSLYVFSGYRWDIACWTMIFEAKWLTDIFFFRFILQAKELGKRIAVVNIGPTRADHLVDLKVEAKASDVLAKINSSLYS